MGAGMETEMHLHPHINTRKAGLELTAGGGVERELSPKTCIGGTVPWMHRKKKQIR